MKRRRHSLQVSTFPFLAVLLCAMGSLILLLLVIDRRAKVVMRAKALAAIRQMEADDTKESDARAAEYEARRSALRERLQQEKQKLQDQSVSVERQLTAAAHELQTEQAQIPALEQRLQAEKDNLIRQERAAASAVQDAKQKRDQSQATSAELTRLSGELIKLEQTLDDLKSVRQKQKQIYSLVPYRGRRGDNRRPIYLECTKEALIFHPDRLILPATDSSGSAILDEVESRINRQQPAGGLQSEKRGTPYLLLLVRPNGIVTYYRALAALRNVKTDFGYEFVEADWVLDFPQDERATQPWMVAGTASAESEVHRSPERTQKSPQPVTAQLGSAGSYARQRTDLTTGSPSSSGPLGSATNGGGNTISGSPGNAGTGIGGSPASAATGRGDTISRSPGSAASDAGDTISGSMPSAASGGGESPGNAATGGGGSPGSAATGGGRSPGDSPTGGGNTISRPLGSAASGEGDTISGSLGSAASGEGDTVTNSQKRGHRGDSPPQFQGLPGFPDGGDLYRFRHFASLPTAMGVDRLKPGETAANGPGSGGSSSTGPTISGPRERPQGTPATAQPRGGAFAATRGPEGTSPAGDQGQSQSVGNIGQRGDSSPRFLASPLSAASPFSRDPIGERSASTPANASPFSTASSSLNGSSFTNSSSLPNLTGTPSASSLLPTLGAPSSQGGGRSGRPPGDANAGIPSDAGNTGPQTSGSPGLGQADGPPEKKSSAPPVVHRYVTRDWNIFIECAADHVVVYPGGLQVPVASIGSNEKTRKESLLQAIHQMIARRQAVIASAETSKDAPQSPQIRFLVRPDGLRTYFLAYPELEPLHLSMTRENLDRDEDVVRHMMGR